jgi:hypothetical protein
VIGRGVVIDWGRQSGGFGGASGRWVGLLWVVGGNPVVSRCSTTGYKPALLAGCEFGWVWLPVVSLVDSLNHRLGAVIPAG